MRRRGWAQSVGEREAGVASVSAPVRGPGGRVVAAVSVSGPIERLTRQPGRLHAQAVVAAAANGSPRPCAAAGLSRRWSLRRRRPPVTARGGRPVDWRTSPVQRSSDAAPSAPVRANVIRSPAQTRRPAAIATATAADVPLHRRSS